MATEKDIEKIKKQVEKYKSKLGIEGDLKPGSIIIAARNINKNNQEKNVKEKRGSRD